jgi:hypothetical protein
MKTEEGVRDCEMESINMVAVVGSIIREHN